MTEQQRRRGIIELMVGRRARAGQVRGRDRESMGDLGHVSSRRTPTILISVREGPSCTAGLNEIVRGGRPQGRTMPGGGGRAAGKTMLSLEPRGRCAPAGRLGGSVPFEDWVAFDDPMRRAGTYRRRDITVVPADRPGRRPENRGCVATRLPSLIDTNFPRRFMESDGEVDRTLPVLMTRGSRHPSRRRKHQTTHDGLRMAVPRSETAAKPVRGRDQSSGLLIRATRPA